jgi:hypothetical protein
MKRSFILASIFVSFIGLFHASAQSITPSILNAAGGTSSIGSVIIDYSIGEMALVNTYSVDTLVVTQGLLQNDISIPASVPNTALAQHLKVYPNPASSVVNIQYTSAGDGTLSYRLMDMAGKEISKSSTEVSAGTTKQQINVSGLAVASYMLEVTCNTGDNNQQTTSYKIQKLK